MIDPDFRAGLDSVLSFPEFHQPGFTLSIELYGQCVDDHLETGRHIVVEPGISCGFLPCVPGGGEETVTTMVFVAKRQCQFVQQRTFLTFVHAVDTADYFLLTEMKEKYTEKSK